MMHYVCEHRRIKCRPPTNNIKVYISVAIVVTLYACMTIEEEMTLNYGLRNFLDIYSLAHTFQVILFMTQRNVCSGLRLICVICTR